MCTFTTPLPAFANAALILSRNKYAPNISKTDFILLPKFARLVEFEN